MTTNEIMVSVVGGLLGYWIIGAIVATKKPPSSGSEDSLQDSRNLENQGNLTGLEGQRSQSLASAGDSTQAWNEVLKVSRDASLEEVQSSYRALIEQYHPAKVANLGEDLFDLAEEKTKAINRAYNEALAVVGNRA